MRARRNFRENYNANSSTLHGYTRNVHRVHSPARRAVTLDQSRRVQLRTFDPPPSLSSHHPARIPNRVSVIVWVRFSRAICILLACGVPATGHRNTVPLHRAPLPSPSYPLYMPFSLFVPLLVPAKRETSVPGIPSDKNFNMARREPYHAASACVIFEFYRMKSRNCAATKYARNITRGVVTHRPTVPHRGRKRKARRCLLSMCGGKNRQGLL